MSIGAGLSQARLDAGLSLDQVSDATRVRKGLLEALERDDFDACGGDVYARGHIKSYCSVVGVDPAPFLAEFDAQRRVAPAATPSMTDAFEPERRAAATPARTGPNWSAAMAVALALVVVVGVVGLLTRGSGGGAPAPAAAASTSSRPAATTSPSKTTATTPTSKPSPTIIASRPTTSGVLVVLTVTGKSSWVSASNGKGGKTFYEGILDKGQTKTFTDKKKVRLVLGSAGNVSLNVNGHDLGSPGSKGQVVKVEFVPGDPTQTQG